MYFVQEYLPPSLQELGTMSSIGRQLNFATDRVEGMMPRLLGSDKVSDFDGSLEPKKISCMNIDISMSKQLLLQYMLSPGRNFLLIVKEYVNHS